MPEHERLRGHTGGNLLLSMMERYSGDFLAAVDGLRALLGCEGRVWPVSIEQASICAQYGDGSRTRGEVEVDAGQSAGHAITRLWLEPEVRLHESAAAAIEALDAVVIGPGSFYTSLMPIFLVRGASEAVRKVRGPVILVTNLVTEGQGMWNFTAGEAVRRMEEAIGRPVDVAIVNTARPSAATLERYLAEHKHPLEIGDVPATCEAVTGDLWGATTERPVVSDRGAGVGGRRSGNRDRESGEGSDERNTNQPIPRSTQIARHDRRRLAQAVWAVLAKRLL
jgi:uncharacterized cofD-like protein